MTAATEPTVLRAARVEDAGRVEAITRGVGLFRDDEIPVALEVFTTAAAGTDTYEAMVAERHGLVVGWAAWGPTPCTLGTWDLYWIAVDATCHGHGIGTALMAEVERRLLGVARLVLVETAGRDDYAPTRAFYEGLGYRPVSRIPDFYAPGDDRVTYIKHLGA